MQTMIAHWFVSAVALVAVAYILPGFKVDGFGKALLAAVVIGLANAVLRPLLMFLAIPLNLLTLGLFTLVVNAIVLKVCAALTPGFEIESWLSAIGGGVLLSIVSALIYWLAAGLR